MSASYTAYSDHNLLYVRYEGHHRTRQTDDLVPYYTLDPDVRRGMRCVIDCARLTSAQVDVERRRAQMDRLKEELKAPDRSWSLTYYCPNSVSQSLTEMQARMWREHEGIDFHMATTPNELARVLQEPLDFVMVMLGLDDQTF